MNHQEEWQPLPLGSTVSVSEWKAHQQEGINKSDVSEGAADDLDKDSEESLEDFAGV